MRPPALPSSSSSSTERTLPSRPPAKKGRIVLLRTKKSSASPYPDIHQLLHQLWEANEGKQHKQWEASTRVDYSTLTEETLTSKLRQRIPDIDTFLPYLDVATHLDHLRRCAQILTHMYRIRHAQHEITDIHRSTTRMVVVIARSKMPASDRDQFQARVGQQRAECARRKDELQQTLDRLTNDLRDVQKQWKPETHLANLQMNMLQDYLERLVFDDLDCSTTNIVYVMTCPCGKYEFIDSTPANLSVAMAHHRNHGNRIIHEVLTGHRFSSFHLTRARQQEQRAANHMRLYYHSARCPIALRTFLDCNPTYWCFIPKQRADVASENIEYLYRMNIDEAAGATAESAYDEHREAHDLNVPFYRNRVPKPPGHYLFTLQQRQGQRQFFLQLLRSTPIQIPYRSVDLYQYKILAKVPEQSTRFVRYMVETLFTAHGETRLNMIYPTERHPQLRKDSYYEKEWCINMHY